MPPLLSPPQLRGAPLHPGSPARAREGRGGTHREAAGSPGSAALRWELPRRGAGRPGEGRGRSRPQPGAAHRRLPRAGRERAPAALGSARGARLRPASSTGVSRTDGSLAQTGPPRVIPNVDLGLAQSCPAHYVQHRCVRHGYH